MADFPLFSYFGASLAWPPARTSRAAGLTKHYPCSARSGTPPGLYRCLAGSGAMNRLQTIDVALDEMLVNLAAIVLRLSNPDVTRTPEARRALAQSVHQYAVCARRSRDPRVHDLKSQLEETLKPNLRVVARNDVTVS